MKHYFGNGNIVSFGKYQGQPVDRLLADRKYCQWLIDQSWFCQNFPALRAQIISEINDGGGPPLETQTPEHNLMQARFLQPSWCKALATYFFDGVDEGSIGPREFERDNWDVVFSVELHGDDFTRWHKLYVECKPTMSDDYPAVLRQVQRRVPEHAFRRDGIYIVLVGDSKFQFVTWAQVRDIFAASKIQLVAADDVNMIATAGVLALGTPLFRSMDGAS